MPDLQDRPELVVFSDDWGRHPSSCQHLVRRLKDDYRVLWVNSIGTRKLRLNLFTLRRAWEKMRGWGKGLTPVDDEMAVIDVPMLPWIGSRPSRLASRLMVTKNLKKHLNRLGFHRPFILSTLPQVSWLVGDVGQRGLLYYCTDDYSHWPEVDRKAMQYSNDLMIQRADLVLAVSHQLKERCSLAKRCEYFPHAVDFDHFSRTATARTHPDLSRIAGPRIGFFGLIYEKLDFELLSAIAREFPQTNLVLIGRVDYCPDSLAALPNVHFVGPKPYDELPEWLAGMDVLLMPYVLDDMIRKSNPLKLRECLATGKPTVAVEVPEARKFEPHLKVATTHSEFIEAIRTVLSGTVDVQAGESRRQSVAAETWETRARELTGYIQAIDERVGLAC